MKTKTLLTFAVTLLTIVSQAQNKVTMLVGTYTYTTSKGIYNYQFDQETGDATLLKETKINSPSFLTYSKERGIVYCLSDEKVSVVTDVYCGFGVGGPDHVDQRITRAPFVNAYKLNKETGEMTLINRREAKGEGACYIATNDEAVTAAFYNGGSISSFGLNADGSLQPATSVIQFKGSGPDSTRQNKSYLHCTHFSPDGKYLFAVDLGGDCFYTFKMNKDTLQPGTPPSYPTGLGSGPRHMTFSPKGDRAYVITELGGTVIAYTYDAANGNMKEIQTVVADTVGARGSADIHISPDGKYLYATNRLKADGIVTFKIDNKGLLKRVGYQPTGVHPRNFAITPNGKFVVVGCQDSDYMQVFKRDPKSGLLTDINKEIKLAKPVCIQFIAPE